MTAQVPQPRTGDSLVKGDHLDAELSRLRDKAERMAGELNDLYRRLGELQRQIHNHQQRQRHTTI